MLERTFYRRNDLISNEDFKKLLKSKRLNNYSNEEMLKLQKDDEYDFYPNW